MILLGETTGDVATSKGGAWREEAAEGRAEAELESFQGEEGRGAGAARRQCRREGGGGECAGESGREALRAEEPEAGVPKGSFVAIMGRAGSGKVHPRVGC